MRLLAMDGDMPLVHTCTIQRPDRTQGVYDLIKIPHFDASGERKELLVVMLPIQQP